MAEQYLWYLQTHIPDVMSMIRNCISTRATEPSHSGLFITCKLLYAACPQLAIYHDLHEVTIVKHMSKIWNCTAIIGQLEPYSYIIQMHRIHIGQAILFHDCMAFRSIAITFAWLILTNFTELQSFIKGSNSLFTITRHEHCYETEGVISQFIQCYDHGYIGNALMSLVYASLPVTARILYVVLTCCIIHGTSDQLIRRIPWHSVVRCKWMHKLLIANRITIEIDAEHDPAIYQQYRKSLRKMIPCNDTGYWLIRMRYISM